MNYFIRNVNLLLIAFSGFFFGQTVTAQDKIINVNLYDNNDPYNNSQWNNQLITQSYPFTSGVYKYNDGSASGIFSTISASQTFADNGAGYATTMCPSQVGRYASYYATTRTITFKGLNNAKFYTIQLYCSRVTSQGTTRNTINGVNVDIGVYNNFTNIATFLNIVPSAGQIVLTQTVLNSYVYLNGFTITEKTTGGSNQSPTANAGSNQTITLPASSVTLTGSGTDADGTIASYAWAQTSGTALTIASPSSASTNITGLTTAGVRVFRLTVTDNQGATGTSDVTITVNAANQPPIANAGSNQTIILPASPVTLTGSGTDADGTIASYAWAQTSGTAATIASPSSATTNITGLTTAGVRVFRLTVTDNQGATGTSTVTITVNAAGNQPPTANAGPNQTITLPASSVTLTGSGTDADGTIASYAWTQISGTAATIASPSSASTNITGLTTAGVRVFRLTVTDNQGATATSDATITVNADTGFPNVTTNNPQTISTTTASLTSSATAAAGIASTKWTKFSIAGQAVKSLTVVGSSTSAGNGTTNSDSAYVNRFKAYYQAQGILGAINNLAISGSSVFDVNITAALNFGAPVLLVNYPSDAYAGYTYSVSTICAKYQEIADSCAARGVQFYTTGTQPRDDYSPSDRIKLNVINDSLRNRFGTRFIDFLTVVLNPSDNSIKPEYAAGDAIHLNNSGHEKLFQLVRAANIFQNTISSPSIIGSPTSANTSITGLTQGVHQFQVSVIDNGGYAASAVAKITVNTSLNEPPVARAGTDQTITLPVNAVSLNGATSTDDHTIVSYQWTKLTGSGGTFTTAAASATTFTGLGAGIYTVELRVTDDSSAVARDTVQITVIGASILNSDDPVITYNPDIPPTQPPAGQIGKWVRTVRMTWNTDSWKSYILNGLAFRLKFPKTYNPYANDGKKYPMIIFLHGKGEVAPQTPNINYDNEYSLANGGPVFTNAVDNGTFDGYVLVPQAPAGGWFPPSHFAFILQIIDYMVQNNKLDPFRVVLNGLSDGAFNSWDLTQFKQSYIAARLPMSGISLANIVDTAKLKFTPIWNFQGGLDHAPDPYIASQVKAAYNLAGANFKSTLYPDLGHGTWSTAWAESDFFPFINRAYSANPWPLSGRTEFCPNDPINVTVGVNPGYDGYQWRKDSVIIPGAATNTIQVTQAGKYDARVLKGSLWSEWSRIPVVIKIKTATITPPITVSGLMSKVIPALDTNRVTLKVPSGYISYIWQKSGNNTAISTDSTLNVTTPGDYIVKVTEQYGCSSNFSSPFTVIDANGPNKPDAPISVSVSTISKTSLKLDWSQNPAPQNNETNFEIYQSLQPGGPYKLTAITGADVSSYVVTGLSFAGTKYYYKLRAVNNTGASAASNEASGTTDADLQAPSSPSNLTVTSNTRTAVSLSWGAATDDVGVVAYDIYVDGVKSYTTPQTQFTVSALNYGQSYNFTVKARDFAGNISVASNQVTGQPLLTGLNYKYYTFTGTWNNMPDFNTLTPVATGSMANVAIVPRTQNDNFAFLWQGYISIPATGTYYFRTNSDDGSKLYLGTLDGTVSPYSYAGTAIVNNDGVHGAADVTSAAQTLTAGVYPVAITFYEQGGSEAMIVSWRTPSTGTNYVTIPDNAFSDAAIVNGQAPANPSNLTAIAGSYKRINLNWTDNSNNEKGFEIWRSTNASNGFITIGTVSANATTYADSSLNASTTYYYKLRAIGQYGESAFSGNGVGATTYALPAAPAPPTGLAATGTSPSGNNISWNDVASNETGYELYRSNNVNTNYILLTTLPVNTTSYTDSSLFANATYYYKVRAVNVGGPSAYSNEDSALTANHLPVITKFNNKTARYGITTAIPVTATDMDAGTLSFAIQNKPAFVTLTDNGNRSAILTLNPAITDQNTYNNIRIIVNDANNGADTTVFNLTVNDNYDPAIDSIPNYTLNENDSLSIPLTATDQNDSDVLTWSVINLPNVFTLIPGVNGAATLQLKPTYAAAGVYTVEVNVSDGKEGMATRQFILTINDKDPNTKIYTRIKYANNIGAPWNNITGITTANLKDEFNNTTTVGLNFQQSWWLPYNAGPATGNNSGVYPDAVLNDFWYFGYYGGPQTANVAVTGLNPAKKYNLTFYAGSVFNSVPDNGTTTYTVGTQTVSLYVQNNTQNTISINNIIPAADGSITVNMAKGANTPIGYLNALVITALYDDGTAPATPKILTAQNVSGQGVKLSWQDAAYNETGYEVYRSLSAAGTFTLVGTAQNNAGNYTDASVSGATQYYYKIRAINSYGSSGYSNVTSITTINRIPQINPISDIVVMSNLSTTINVTATDDATDHIRLTASGLPSFAAFVDNGNGTGVVNIQPTASSLGTYSGITITAKDNSDSSRSVSFNIYVVDANVTSAYVNITDNNNQAPGPWNNMTIGYLPYAGTAISNLKDDRNINTGISVTLTDAWQAASSTGMRRRNGSELYPETVSRSGIYFTDNAAHRITVSGLNPAKKYNFVFYSSHSTSESTLTNFAISSQTVSLNGCHNSNKTVQINGIVPAANGQVTINVTKNASAISGLLSALVIQSYTPGVVSTFGPADLRVLDYSATNTISLQWQDRADNETGYEVWRANDGGTYSLLATLAANSTSYVNTGLAANTAYNYIVRAKNGSAYSSYSNAVRGYTYASTVFINVNTNNAAGSPWNNLNWIYGVGAVWNNFRNEAGVSTNIGMIQPVKIDGMVTPGVNTGNNSGVFPDNVLAESFGLFPGLSSYIKLTGLNLSKVYDITLTASITGVYGDNTTAYTINGKTCLLNSIMNKDGTLTMFGIVPDQNGEVTISFTSYPGATFALLGALVIKGYDKASVNGSPAIPSAMTVSVQQAAAKGEEPVPAVQQGGVVRAYPNPFDQYIMLTVPAAANDNIRVLLSDVNGKIIYEKQYDHLGEGNNVIRIQPGNGIVPGMYFIQVIYSGKGKQHVISVIKQR